MQSHDLAEPVLGTMYLGTTLDRAASFDVLDRFVELGGRWLDTADNYAFWRDGTGLGGASERTIGAWLAARPGMRSRVLISTKVGADPMQPHRWPETMEGLGASAIERAIAGSLDRLGTDHVDLYWAHVEDRTQPLGDIVETFGALVEAGAVRRIGASNHATWMVERARQMAKVRGREPYSAMQLRHTLLQPIPFAPIPDAGGHVVASPEALDYVAAEGLDLWAYNTLLSGGYSDRSRVAATYRHQNTDDRLRALDDVAASSGATANQVVLSWLMGASPRVHPIVGVSSLAQLDEVMAAREIVLDAGARARLDEGMAA